MLAWRLCKRCVLILFSQEAEQAKEKEQQKVHEAEHLQDLERNTDKPSDKKAARGN